jgi:hypothetical protein
MRPLLALALLIVLNCSTAAAATRYDPALRFRSLQTRHFVIHYHQGEEGLALRLASIAEAEYGPMVARLRHAPATRTHIVLVDQDDDPNGAATPLPYNLVEIRAVPPPGNEMIGNTDDWLHLVFVHEFSHVLHLDRARGWARAVRAVFGRAPIGFPNLFLPEWQVEGLAVYEESRGTTGRLSAGDFRAVVDEAARAKDFEPLDRVNGGLIAWPSGTGWYAYGGLFHEYLADRFGDERLAALAERTSGRFPYLASGAFQGVFGESLGALWRDFERRERGRAGDHAAGPVPTRLTAFGYLTDSPRFERDGTILAARVDAHEFPSLVRIVLGAAPAHLASRYGGGQIAPARDAIYFDQLELRHDVGLVSDLYRLDRRTGDVRRLTHGARLSEPDVSPDGSRIAAILTGRGERRLVILDVARLEAGGAGAVEALEHARRFGRPGDIMATPRWSPDGSLVALESRRLHSASTIVLFHADDPAGNGTTIADSDGRNVTPAWAPDGQAVVYAHDGEDGKAFNLQCARVGDDGHVRSTARITNLDSGAHSPDVSPDGRTIVFVGYTTAGQDIFTLPYSCPEAASGTPSEPRIQAPRTEPAEPPHADTPYRPWSTVWPRAWSPVVEHDDDEWRVGGSTGGVDALGYHWWTASATWSVARAHDLEPVAPGARPDVTLLYFYDRWRPSFFAQYADETSPLRFRPPGGLERPVAIREQSVDLGVTLPFRRVRCSQAVLGSFRREHDTVRGPADEGSFDRGALRAGWSLTSAKRYGYSISPEDGVTVGASVERALEALGSDGNATFVRGDLRAYVGLGPRHAIAAVRVTGAGTEGDAPVRRILRLGGTGADPAVISFDEDASSLLRGFSTGQFAGTRLALVNADYRVPLVRVERGYGTWPLFLRTIHATGFFDTGAAWTDEAPALSAWARSWGGEISADVVAGFMLPLTFTAGIARGEDGSGRVPASTAYYVRLGHGF